MSSEDDQDAISSGSVDIRRQVEDLRGFAKSLRRDFEEEKEELHEEIEELYEENYRLRHELEETKQELAEVKETTNLLQFVKEQNKPEAEQAKAALILSLKKKAEKRADRHDKRPVARLDRDEAQHVLNHPDVHRTTINKWMERAAEMVDGNLLQYYDGQLKINLQVGDVPSEVVTSVTEGDL